MLNSALHKSVISSVKLISASILLNLLASPVMEKPLPNSRKICLVLRSFHVRKDSVFVHFMILIKKWIKYTLWNSEFYKGYQTWSLENFQVFKFKRFINYSSISINTQQICHKCYLRYTMLVISHQVFSESK